MYDQFRVITTVIIVYCFLCSSYPGSILLSSESSDTFNKIGAKTPSEFGRSAAAPLLPPSAGGGGGSEVLSTNCSVIWNFSMYLSFKLSYM